MFGAVKVFDWHPDKNQQLIEERGRSFEEAVFYIENGGLIDDVAHPNTGVYQHQRLFIVAIEDYVYVVPYVENDQQIFLETIIPSRKFSKKYLRGHS